MRFFKILFSTIVYVRDGVRSISVHFLLELMPVYFKSVGEYPTASFNNILCHNTKSGHFTAWHHSWKSGVSDYLGLTVLHDPWMVKLPANHDLPGSPTCDKSEAWEKLLGLRVME